MARIVYDVHPGVEKVQGWIAALRENTGRSLEQWMRHIRKDGPKTEAAARAWLKREHGIGANTAWWLVMRAHKQDLSLMEDDPRRYLARAPKYVEEQYSGKKEVLRPVFERLVSMARTLGRDVKVCPCNTIVPFYREHVFAQVRASTNTRVDLGICLTKLMEAGKKLPARLVDTGGFKKKDRITHRIAIADVAGIDGFVGEWLRRAYELDAKAARSAGA